ncbi:hypothetical protein H5410_058137 [Solanum commersonii]|uniref:ATP-dependent DNA helicase n=1 Tax=Solanum commersonii TaxID=4109 RepID=A0A9J5WPV3_SOLCO|nr:hypothetical protein H5410_058137 [Solanum commersonii]
MNTEIDEIEEYRSARWVSPPEATWRLFGFPINKINPSVYHLQLHLDGQQFVSFRSAMSVDTIINNSMIKRTMLTEFFVMNRENDNAKRLNLLYKEFPQHFVWSVQYKIWSRRKKHSVIRCVVTCHPTESERYYLRLLLMNVRGPKSYKDLQIVNDIPYDTFREATEKRGLLQCDNNLTECMMEAMSYQMPCILRRLFATLLVYCDPANPRELWEKFEAPMSEDFNVLPNRFEEAKEIYFERNITVSEEDLLLEKKLNLEQRATYNVIINIIFSNKSGAFFIDGPGGTGKTFLYRALLATVQSKGYIVLATATSGVAASILPGGRTAHSRFKIPIDIDENFSCNISKQSSLGLKHTDPAFCEYLMRIGNGKEPLNTENKIEIPNSFIQRFQIFCDSAPASSPAILKTKNNEINDMLINKFPKDAKIYVAIDETVEPADQSQFEDFLHTLYPAGLPPYKLVLKKNCPIILLRNLNPCEGLCNGTRLTCCDFKTHIISAKVNKW